MGLLDAIPGLAEHQVLPPAEPVRSGFDQVRAFKLMGDALSLLASFYPAGALEWLRENRQDVTAFLAGAEAEVDAAVLREDQAAFARCLEVFVSAHKKAFDLFLCRPPVIEVQHDLFVGAA